MNSNLSIKKPVLMVDDNEDDYEAVNRAFKKAGLLNPTFLCKSGREAMDYLTGDREKPQLILLDLNMPGMDGHEVLRQIKEDENLRCIPVIIWTTSSNERDVDRCYQLGANVYMQKPVSYGRLQETIRFLKEYWFETARLPNVDTAAASAAALV